VGVICEARHFCMMMRGVEKQHSGAMTSAMLGILFRDRKKTRDEFLALVNHRGNGCFRPVSTVMRFGPLAIYLSVDTDAVGYPGCKLNRFRPRRQKRALHSRAKSAFRGSTSSR
jgi:hypothetical protein